MTESQSSSFELRAGGLRLALRPDLGGSIAGLWHGATPILRSTEPPALAGSRDAGCFPLLPYSNRLAYRRFRWKGRDYTTAANFDASPHSLHGVGWLRRWDIESSSAVEVVLRCVHVGDADWPFAFEARQYFTLTPQSMSVQMVFTNTADVVQPVGLGWHPYFLRRARSRLHIEVSDRWDTDATHLPTRKLAQPGIDGDVVHLDFDHCFEGWRGPARIRDEKFSLQLTSSLPYLVVYTPPDKEYFCVEPVSHVPDAIHRDEPLTHGLKSVAPGERIDASMKLEIGVL
ncbi:MAG: aldose 1-epimerase [Burkholderiaceae bacterium]